MAIDPIFTLSSTILLNIASDIVAHQAKRLENTFAGRLLKWGGLIKPDFSDRLRESIQQALQPLFQDHPDYVLSGVEDFFRDPSMTNGIELATSTWIIETYIADSTRKLHARSFLLQSRI
jgi:hypothetical protein